jgi:hypothetical protein
MQHDQRRIVSPRIGKVVDVVSDPNSVACPEMVEHRESPGSASGKRFAKACRREMLPNFPECRNSTASKQPCGYSRPCGSLRGLLGN